MQLLTQTLNIYSTYSYIAIINQFVAFAKLSDLAFGFERPIQVNFKNSSISLRTSYYYYYLVLPV